MLEAEVFWSRIVPALNHGMIMTVALIVPSAILGFFGGVVVGTLRVFAPLWVRRIADGYVALFRGVQTVPFDAAALPADKVSQAAIDELLKRGVVQQGDWVILTKGDSYHTIGGTNTMKILHVGDVMV